MKTKCPSCGTIQKCPELYSHKTIKCLECKYEFTAIPFQASNSHKITIFLTLLTIIVLAGLVGYSYVKYIKTKAEPGKVSNHGLNPMPSPSQTSSVASGDYFHPPVKSGDIKIGRTKTETALRKIKHILYDGIMANRDISTIPWMAVYAEPMTNAQLELAGDYFLKQKRKKNRVDGLKIQVYWNINVANICVNAGYFGESQFYNSFLDVGKRGETLGAPYKKLKSSNYKDLIGSLRKSGFIYGDNIEYDHKNQTLHLDIPAKCMIELISQTFSTLRDGRGCLFDRLPHLKAVTIHYKDYENNKYIREIGEGTFDINYWSQMKQTPTIPAEVYTEFTRRRGEVYEKTKSKGIIQEPKLLAQLDQIDKDEQQVKRIYFKKKWEKLKHLIKDFRVDENLPADDNDCLLF